MVLEGASGPQTDAFDNDRPFSDMDPYDQTSSSSSQASELNINFQNLSKPMPIMSSLFGTTSQKFEDLVVKGITVRSKQIGRPFSQDEIDGMAQAYTKAISYVTWGEGSGVLAGLARCYQTADTFKLPVGKLPIRIPNPDKFGPLRGPAARWVWHGLRAVPYVTIGFLGIGGFATVVAGTILTVDMSRDPRLKDVVAAMAPPKRGLEGRAGDRRAGSGTAISSQVTQDDDMSPQSSYDGALLSDTQMRIQEQSQQQQRQTSLPDNRDTHQIQENPTSQWSPLIKPPNKSPNTPYDLDDANDADDWDPPRARPVVSSGRLIEFGDDKARLAPQKPETDSKKESSWDRLRREAAEKANR